MLTYEGFVNNLSDINIVEKMFDLSFWSSDISNYIIIELSNYNIMGRKISIMDSEMSWIKLKFRLFYHKTGHYKILNQQEEIDSIENVRKSLVNVTKGLYDVSYNILNRIDSDFYKVRFIVDYEFVLKDFAKAAGDMDLL